MEDINHTTDPKRERYVSRLLNRVQQVMMTESREKGIPLRAVPWEELKDLDQQLVRYCGMYEDGEVGQGWVDDAATVLLKRWRTMMREVEA